MQLPRGPDSGPSIRSTGQGSVSIAHMRSPSGWAEPGQRPEFDEFTVVLRGVLVVESEQGLITVRGGQGVHAGPGELGAVEHPGSRRRRVHLGLRARVRPGYGSPGRIARSRRAQAFPRRPAVQAPPGRRLNECGVVLLASIAEPARRVAGPGRGRIGG